ncbi:hypothetical protein HDU92_005102 [Lobulomyces angularis]|nr:hypothetical protein HDU92_005102 [Lobulomyces angularis]
MRLETRSWDQPKHAQGQPNLAESGDSEPSALILNDFVHFHSHQGTSDDITYLSQQLKFKFSEFNSRLTGGYGQTLQKANELNKQKLGDFFCSSFDYIIIGDTIPDARFLLQRLVMDIDRPCGDGDTGNSFCSGGQCCSKFGWCGDTIAHCSIKNCLNGCNMNELEFNVSPKCGTKKIIFLVTNRFDFAIPDKREYFNLILKTKKYFPEKIHWISNNPYENKYLEAFKERKELKYEAFQFLLIRPFGHSTLPETELFPLEDRLKPVLIHQEHTENFTKILDEHQINYKLLPKKYGGPTALNQFKCFITIPYQVSTMKLYENINNGVVMLIPSRKYLIELMNLKPPMFDFSMLPQNLQSAEDKIFNFIDYYNDDLKKFFFYFDSIEDLKNILKNEMISQNFEKGQRFDYGNLNLMNFPKIKDFEKFEWKKSRLESLEKWKKVLES